MSAQPQQRLEYVSPEVNRRERYTLKHPVLIWWRRHWVTIGFVWMMINSVCTWLVTRSWNIDSDYEPMRELELPLVILQLGWLGYGVASLVLTALFDRPKKAASVGAGK